MSKEYSRESPKICLQVNIVITRQLPDVIGVQWCANKLELNPNNSPDLSGTFNCSCGKTISPPSHLPMGRTHVIPWSLWSTWVRSLLPSFTATVVKPPSKSRFGRHDICLNWERYVEILYHLGHDSKSRHDCYSPLLFWPQIWRIMFS